MSGGTSLDPVKSILIVDDDELDAALTERAIGRILPNASVRTVQDGQEALEVLQHLVDNAETSNVQLVLMDFKMPKMGCLDVLRSLGGSEVASRLPVVVFSSSVGPTDVLKCLKAGAREFVEKPTDPDEYNHRVSEVCRRYFLLT